MEQSLDAFFLKIPEPQQSTLLFLRQFLISEIGLQENWKFNTPVGATTITSHFDISGVYQIV